MQKLTCKIINVEQDPLHIDRVIVSIRFKEYPKDKGWIQAFSMQDPKRMISMEEMKAILLTRDIKRPIDSFRELRKAKTYQTKFEIDLSHKHDTKKLHDNI